MTVDQIIYLQDFPRTANEVRALINLGFDQIDGVYVIEEVFNRDIEDEGDMVETPDQSDPTVEEQELAAGNTANQGPTETA